MVDKLIKRKEAAEMLGISLDTLDHARMEGLITYVQYVENGCVYFTEVGLQEYIARSTHRARPKDTPPTPAPSAVTATRILTPMPWAIPGTRAR